MFDWAKFQTAKGGLKMHTSWDDNLQIPDLVNITQAKTHDRYSIGQLVFSKGTIIWKTGFISISHWCCIGFKP